MLDIYKDKQPLFYEEISNSISNKKISHAYMIETNNYLESDKLIIEFIKTLFHSYINDEEEYLNIQTLIDNNTFSDFIIIEPDGSMIKKEQILDIKEKFKTTSTEDRPRIYLIKESDKLNKYAANSLLKFLEEPDGNVIAVLETENRYKVLETIRSRCQIYTLLSTKNKKEIEDIDNLLRIIETLEQKGQASIVYLPIVLDNNYQTREFWINTFTNMIDIYESAIRKREKLDFNDYGNILDIINNSNTLQQIINKIDTLFTTINNLEYNLNITMMLDKFIIEFTGGE